MSRKIESGQFVTVAPVGNHVVEIADHRPLQDKRYPVSAPGEGHLSGPHPDRKQEPSSTDPMAQVALTGTEGCARV